MDEHKIKKINSLQEAMSIYGKAAPIDSSDSVCKEVEGVPEIVPTPSEKLPSTETGILQEHLAEMNIMFGKILKELQSTRLGRVTGSEGIEGEGMWYVTDEVPVRVATPNLPPATPGGQMQAYDPDLIAFDTFTQTFGPSSIGYQRERVRDVLKTRNAPRCTVINDGDTTIFVISSVNGRKWSPETPILPYEARTFFNVWELRIRCEHAGILTTTPFTGGVYRITEFDYWLAYSRIVTVAGAAVTINVNLTPVGLFSLAGYATLGGAAIIAPNNAGLPLTPLHFPTTLKVEIAMSASGQLSAIINGISTLLNANVLPPALVVNGLYIFSIALNAGDTFDLSYNVPATVQVLRIQEIDSATA